MTLNFNEILLRDSELLKVLSTLKGIPKNMTIYELIHIRKTIPNIVENWINFMNNEQFLHDYEYGKISKDVYHDLQKSIVFLRIGKFSFSFTNYSIDTETLEIISSFVEIMISIWYIEYM
ncbi:unnamed protein product [Schistosoma mattheei]|uniref:Uncharacterized protein n=1 Tax=Schistosoma mattheei TaxID=31246 RepID=A0A183NNX4_9TREM|nr:unnamed protein product [Schistosoma mattheei]